MNDVRWYLRRGGRNLVLILDDWIKLLSPFAPHLCEELWHIKHDSFVSLEPYPECDESKIDEEAEKAEEYLKRLIEDILEVKKFVREARVAHIYPAEGWKVKASEVVVSSENVGEAMKILMQDEEMRKRAKEVSDFVKRVFQDRKMLVIIDERRVLEENIGFIEAETGLKISLDSSSMPEEKKKVAIPGKPAIYIT